MPVCDVCSQAMQFAEGYALTTREVTTAEKYWSFLLEQHRFDDELLAMYVQQQAVQVSGWLVCESCSSLFHFDRATAREHALRQANPPGSGSADVQEVSTAAAKAWRVKYGRLPAWVR